MKLLFDENLSRRLVELVSAEFPGSSHPDLENLRGASDADVWDYAGTRNMIIVSKDNDFRQRAFLQGPPPKVIWLAVGNAGTTLIAGILRDHSERIQHFCEEPESALLILRPA